MPDLSPEELAALIDAVIRKRRQLMRVSNAIFDPEAVTCLVHVESKVKVWFTGGNMLEFVGDEALEIWRIFDEDKGWQ